MVKGDIILIPFPFTDLKGQKKRPAIVLTSDNSDVTVSFITTKLKWYSKLDIKLKPSENNGLKKPSMIKLNKIATIEKELVVGILGKMKYQKIDELNQKLKLLLHL